MLAVAVINADAYLFFFCLFSDLTYHIEDTGIGVSWLHFALIIRRPNLEVATKRFLHQ